MLVECPSLACKESQVLQLIRQPLKGLPIIFLTTGLETEPVADLTADGSFEYVAQTHLIQLPMAVRRLLNERKLRNELEDAKKALRHSQSLYRALADNPTYGIYRCDAEGDLVDANLALLTMLGYDSKTEFFSDNLRAEVIPNLRNDALRAGLIPETQRIEPVELEWKRKDGTKLRARLSGRGIYDDHGNLAGHEIIVVDVTEQRTRGHCAASIQRFDRLGQSWQAFRSATRGNLPIGKDWPRILLLLLDLDGLKRSMISTAIWWEAALCAGSPRL
jgi:PAS domain S-box-containing protein